MRFGTACSLSEHSQSTVGDGQGSFGLHSPRATTCTVDREAAHAGCTRQTPAMTVGVAFATYSTGLLVSLELNPGRPKDS